MAALLGPVSGLLLAGIAPARPSAASAAGAVAHLSPQGCGDVHVSATECAGIAVARDVTPRHVLPRSRLLGAGPRVPDVPDRTLAGRVRAGRGL